MLSDIFKRKATERVLDNQSTREIADARERLNCELRASAYLYDDSKIIICAIAGNAEHGEPIVLEANASNDELGRSICDKLLEFNPKNLAHHAQYKLSDWKAYCVSGANSGKVFERKSYFIYMRTVNSAITIEAKPRITNEKNLSTLCTISSGGLHIEIGSAVRKAINAAKLLRDAGAL